MNDVRLICTNRFCLKEVWLPAEVIGRKCWPECPTCFERMEFAGGPDRIGKIGGKMRPYSAAANIKDRPTEFRSERWDKREMWELAKKRALK